MTLQGNQLQWTPDFAAAGAQAVRVAVSDGTETVEQALQLTVANSNRAPTIVSQPETRAKEGDAYHYALKATDADAEAVQLQLENAPAGMVLNGNTVSWRPAFN